MATVQLNIAGHDQTGGSFRSAVSNIDTLGTAIDKLKGRVTTLGGAFLAYFAADKLVAGFAKGIEAVDSFQQSVIKTAAMITSLQGGENVAENYLKAKSYAEGLQNVLMKVDANTTLNLNNLQAITEEMIKQGIVLDGNNSQQVDGFTRLANAVAVYSNNGRNEVQLRQEVSALLRGEVDQNAQLASMLQKTVQGPLREWVEKHKQAGDLVQVLGDKLSGFGLSSKDLSLTWGAVKSSLETSVSLILRAGFSAIVKDLVEWLGKANEYLKSHQELIGNKIKNAWEDFKKVAEFLVPVLKEMYEHASLFVGLFVGGALIKGLTSTVGLYKDIRNVVREIALIQAGGAIAGGAGAAAGVGTAAAGGAAAGAAGGWLAKARLLPGLKYLLNPVTAALAAGAWVMGAKDTNDIDEMAKIKAFKPDTVASAAAAAPKVDLADSQEQTKRKMDLMNKELAAFKTMEDSKSAIAQSQAEIQLSALKGRFYQGLVATRDYYEEEKRLALDAAQKKLDSASAYFEKEQKLLEFIKAKKGAESPEYQEELSKNRKALEVMQSAALDYAKTSTDLNNKEIEALRQRSEEYNKLKVSVLETAGKYEEAAKAQVEMDKKSIEYLKLKTEAMKGEQDAVEALAVWEQKRSVSVIEGRNKEAESLRTLANETRALQNEWDTLLGIDTSMLNIENAISEGKNKLVSLQERLNLATAQGNIIAVAALSKQISLQSQLNQKKEQQLQYEKDLGVLTGDIVGFSNGKPIYAKDATAGQYKYQSAASAAAVGGAPSSSLSSSSFINGNAFPSSLNSPFLGGFAVGTNYIPADGYAYLHRGEAVVPEKYNPAAGGSGGGITIQGGLNISLPNVTDRNTADDLLRQLIPKLNDYNSRKRAA